MNTDHDSTESIWYQILDIAKWAPTPHNTQAYRVHVINNDTAELLTDDSRSIPSTDPQGQFLYVGLGVFIETLRLAAASCGKKLIVNPLDTTTVIGYSAQMMLQLSDDTTPPDIDVSLIQKRRTSRLPFNGKPVEVEVKKMLINEAKKYNQSLSFSDDEKDISAVLGFNTKILFYDLSHTGLRKELIKWIRWTDKQYKQHKDGFSIPSLNQSSVVMWLFLHVPIVTRIKFVKNRVAKLYEDALSGVGTIGYMYGPFADKSDWQEAGVLMMRLWLLATQYNLYIHPFGSVITNDEARSWALDTLGVKEAPGTMCWLLFRIGEGPEPARSLRKDTKEYFV